MKTLMLSLMLICFGITTEAAMNDNHASWIKGCQGDRIYINSDRLIIEENGIFLVDDSNEKNLLTELFCDSQGIFIRFETEKDALATVYPIVWCRTCNAWRSVDMRGLCVICRNIP